MSQIARYTKMDKPLAILDNTVKNIWITKEEYIKLRADQDVLNALENHGVDNWSGYGDAMDELFGEDDD